MMAASHAVTIAATPTAPRIKTKDTGTDKTISAGCKGVYSLAAG